LRLTAVLLLLLGAAKEGYGQRVYATIATRTPATNQTGITISNHANAQSPDGTTEPSAGPARIEVIGPTIGSTRSGYIQLQFSSTIPQNSTVFLRVANESTSGTGSIAVTARSNDTQVTASTTKFITINGQELYAVNVSGGSINGVRITANGPLLGSAAVSVYYAFYEPTTTACATVLGTSTGGTGLNLGSISSAQNAIDGNLDTYSTFSLTLGLATTLTQTVYFSNVSNPGEAVTATFSVPDGTLSLDLLGDIRVLAYRGGTEVSSQSLSNLLSLDLLGLLNDDNERFTVSFTPSGIFDRVVVSMSSTLGLSGSLRLHEVQRTPVEPEIPDLESSVIRLCEGETASITAQSMPGSVIRWYDAVNNGNLLQQSGGDTDVYVIGPYPVGTSYRYAAAAWNTDCPAESERTIIEIIVSERPPAPNVTLNPNSQY